MTVVVWCVNSVALFGLLVWFGACIVLDCGGSVFFR